MDGSSGTVGAGQSVTMDRAKSVSLNFRLSKGQISVVMNAAATLPGVPARGKASLMIPSVARCV